MSIQDGKHMLISEHTFKKIMKLRVEIEQHPDYYDEFDKAIIINRFEAIQAYRENAVITSKQLYIIGKINGKMKRRLDMEKIQRKLEAIGVKEKSAANDPTLPRGSGSDLGAVTPRRNGRKPSGDPAGPKAEVGVGVGGNDIG